MSNPLAIFEDLRDTYFRYLDSPFDLRYPDLVAERRALLDADGRLYRRPLIEPVPAYQLCGQTFSQAAQALLAPIWPRPTSRTCPRSFRRAFSRRHFRTDSRASCTPTSARSSRSRSSTGTMSWSRRERAPARRSASPADRRGARSRVSAGRRPASATAVGLVESLVHAGTRRRWAPRIPSGAREPDSRRPRTDPLSAERAGRGPARASPRRPGRRRRASVAPSASRWKPVLLRALHGTDARIRKPHLAATGRLRAELAEHIAMRSSSRELLPRASSRTWTAARCGRAGTCRTTRPTS